MNQDAAHSIILVELLYGVDDLVNCSFKRELNVFERDADFLSGLGFHANIGGRIRTGASLDDNKLRLKTGIGYFQRFNLFRDTLADRPGAIMSSELRWKEATNFAIAVPSITFPLTEAVAMVRR